MERYKYRALNVKGRPIRGVVAAANEVDLYKQLQSAGLELIDCGRLNQAQNSGLFASIGARKVKLRDVIQLFVQLEQMQGAGVPMLDALADIRDATENDALRDMMSEVYRDVSEGSAFSEALERHPKVFKPLIISLVRAGEATGDLRAVYLQLIKYLKWLDEVNSKVSKATRYPIIVSLVVLLTVSFMMSFVVPQIVGFLKFLEIDLPFYSEALIQTSDFFVNPVFEILGLPIYGAFVVLFVPAMFYASLKASCAASDDIAYNVDKAFVNAPVIGVIIRKLSIARYAQTFGALYASGIDVLSALDSARETITNRVLIEAMEVVEASVQAGSPLSDAFNTCGEFPSGSNGENWRRIR